MKYKKVKKYCGGILLISCCVCNVHAGLRNFTMHSRANCKGFNESISWQAGHSYTLRTLSHHYTSSPNGVWIRHTIDTGWETTYRSAAYHAREGYGDTSGTWVVYGEHYGVDQHGQPIKLATTKAIDCNIYDGWWG